MVPDPPFNFLPTHLVLRAMICAVSLAPVGFIYNNGSLWHLYLTRRPVRSCLWRVFCTWTRVCPGDGVFSARLYLYHLWAGRGLVHSCGECPARPCPSRHSFCGALSPGSWRGYVWVAPLTWGLTVYLAPSFAQWRAFWISIVSVP